jgi:hypothetical protein
MNVVKMIKKIPALDRRCGRRKLSPKQMPPKTLLDYSKFETAAAAATTTAVATVTQNVGLSQL